MTNSFYIGLTLLAIFAICLDFFYGSTWLITHEIEKMKHQNDDKNDDDKNKVNEIIIPLTSEDGINRKANPFWSSNLRNSNPSGSSPLSFFPDQESNPNYLNDDKLSEELKEESEVHHIPHILEDFSVGGDNTHELISPIVGELETAESIRYSNCSKIRCIDTEFASSPKTDLWGNAGVDDGVCASKTASPLDGECKVSSKNFQSARVYCQNAGTRLCFLEELARGHGWNSGCGSSGMFLWTNTPCMTPAGNRGYFQVNQQKLLGGLGQHQRCVAVSGKAESSPVCCADVECLEDRDVDVALNFKNSFNQKKDARPLITNGRIAVLLFGESARPGCTQAARVAQLTAVQWQKDLMFNMLRAKGFGVDVFVSTNDCGSGWIEALKRAYSPWLRGISVANSCEIEEERHDAESVQGRTSSLLPTKFKKKTCFLKTVLAMLDSYSHLSCSELVDTRVSSSDRSLNKWLLPLAKFSDTGEEGGGHFGGCVGRSPFNTVLIGRPDFIPKPHYGSSLVMDLVASAQSSDYPTSDHMAWPFRCGEGSNYRQSDWEKWRCVDDSLMSIPAVRFDVFRDTCLGRAGCYGNGPNAPHFIGDEMTRQDLYGRVANQRAVNSSTAFQWGGGDPGIGSKDINPVSWGGGVSTKLSGSNDDGSDSGSTEFRKRKLKSRKRRRLMSEDEADGFGVIPKDEYRSGKACFRCASRAIERYPLKTRMFNDSQFVGGGEYKCLAILSSDKGQSAARCEAACRQEGYYYSGDAYETSIGKAKFGLGVDGGVNKKTRQRKCNSWNVRKGPMAGNGTVPDSIAMLGLKVATCSELRCRQTSFTSPQELLGMIPSTDPITCASKSAPPLDGSCLVKDGTWLDAKESCELVGTRLCTLTDLESGLGWGTGCKSNKDYLWTSTPCDEFPADSYGWYYQVNQSEAAVDGAHRRCVPMTDVALASPVCCADSLCNQYGGSNAQEQGYYRSREVDPRTEIDSAQLEDDTMDVIGEINRNQVPEDEEELHFKPVSVQAVVDEFKSLSEQSKIREEETMGFHSAEEDTDNSQSEELADPYPLENVHFSRHRHLSASDQYLLTGNSFIKRSRETRRENETKRHRRRLGCHWVGWKNEMVCEEAAQNGAGGLGVWGAKWESANPGKRSNVGGGGGGGGSSGGGLKQTPSTWKSFPKHKPGKPFMENVQEDDATAPMVNWEFDVNTAHDEKPATTRSSSSSLELTDRNKEASSNIPAVTWQVLKQREARRQQKKKDAEIRANNEKEERIKEEKEQADINFKKQIKNNEKEEEQEPFSSTFINEKNQKLHFRYPSPIKNYFWPFPKPNGKPKPISQLKKDYFSLYRLKFPNFSTCKDIKIFLLENKQKLIFYKNEYDKKKQYLEFLKKELVLNKEKLKKIEEKEKKKMKMMKNDNKLEDPVEDQVEENNILLLQSQLKNQNNEENKNAVFNIDNFVVIRQRNLLFEKEMNDKNKLSPPTNNDGLLGQLLHLEENEIKKEEENQDSLNENNNKSMIKTNLTNQVMDGIEIDPLSSALEMVENTKQLIEKASNALIAIERVNFDAKENITKLADLKENCYDSYRQLIELNKLHRSNHAMTTDYLNYDKDDEEDIDKLESNHQLHYQHHINEFCCLNRGVGLKRMRPKHVYPLSSVSGIMSVDVGHGLAGLTVGFVRDANQISEIVQEAGKKPFYSLAYGSEAEIDL